MSGLHPLVAIAVVCAGCGVDPAPDTPPPRDTVAPADACGAAQPDEWHRHREMRFCVAATPASAGIGRIRVETLAGYKFADDFPHRLELAAGPSPGPGGRLDPLPSEGPDRRDFEFPLPRRNPAELEGTIVFGVCLRDGPCERLEYPFQITP